MSKIVVYVDSATGEAREDDTYDPWAALEWNRYMLAAEKALAAPDADLTNPRYLEQVTIKALELYGRPKIAEALRPRSGRKPAGALTRGEALNSMESHPDPLLRHAATLLPRHRKQRNAKARATSERIPERDIAFLVRHHLTQQPNKNKAYEAVAKGLGPGYSLEYIKNTWNKFSKSKK